MTPLELGRVGLWRPYPLVTPDEAAAVERLGYGAIWLGGSPPAGLSSVESLLAATDRLVIATGVVNIWTAPPAEVAESYHRIEAAYPGRFLLGVGVGHPEAQGAAYRKPYQAQVDYLDALDAGGVPPARRALAALGPRMLELARVRTIGAHPYLTTPEHTRKARELLGAGVLLAPEQKIVLDTDPARARVVGRAAVENPYLHLVNYVNNLKRLGFTDGQLSNGGSDEVIDALVAHGDAQTVASRVRAHLEAGADHVAVQVLPMTDDPLPALEALSQQWADLRSG